MYWKTFDWKSQKVGQKGEVLGKVVYKCAFCKGAGLMPRRRSTTCPVCLGKGTVRVPGSAIICGYCTGVGRSPLNREISCIICKGKGVVPIGSKNIEVCPTCKGMGREKGVTLACLTCKGKGAMAKK